MQKSFFAWCFSKFETEAYTTFHLKDEISFTTFYKK